MTSLLEVELGVLGPLQVRRDGAPVTIPGAKPRAILTMLGLHGGSVVSADTLVELLWGDDPPRTAAKALQTHISLLRRILGDGFVLTEGAGWTLAGTEVDASRYKAAARMGRDAAAAGDTGQAVARFEEALALWRGIPELPDGRRGTSEKTRWIEGHAALVEDRADALLATGRAAEIIGELESAVSDAPLRERRWGQLMLALYRAGRQGEALGAYQRARTLLADELGVDPGPHLRRLEAAIVAQDTALETPVAQNLTAVSRAVTFLLTDIEGSTAAWEAESDAMAAALAKHDEIVEQVVTSRGGRLIKTRGEGDATFSVFERPSAAAAAAIELQEAIVHEPWALREPIRVRVALHTGEVELRDGDYFGRAVNRAARLRSLAEGGQILCSGATAELVIDSLPDDVVLTDLGMRELRNLARPEHVFELRLETAADGPQPQTTDVPIERPSLPAVLAGPGPFVGRLSELERLFSAWQTALAGTTTAVLIAGEPGVGKTRLAGEWSRQAYDEGALVIYGRCDEDLAAPYQPFAEALRSLVPCLGASGLRGLRGVEALLALVPGLTDVLPDLAPPTRADPDTERYALFDAVVGLLGVASASVPVVLILDDLHWAAKPTLLLLRHLLRFGEQTRVQVIGTYRSTDLDRSHPLAAMLADLHRDGIANRIQLSGLDENDVTAYVAEAGYNDEELARALASVTGGNPFFLIEALRHVDESGGRWDQSTLPQGVREAVSRRLSRLAPETNKALAAAAVVGSRFALELVERVVGDDLVDAFDEACKAGIVIEEPGGRYRFNHAIVRQSLLAELASVRRMRLHQRIAATLENEPGADDELLAELAHHYFECAWAGNAAKAVFYCRRAADQAMTRLAYEGAADLYDHALHALEELDEELPDRDDQVAELMVARCEALLAAGDVASAAGAVSQLQQAAVDSARLAAWATCFDGQLSMLIHPERLDEIEAAVGAAAEKLAALGDSAGEAKAHTVRATCLARLGRIGDCEVALDDALTAARRAREHRRVNAVLANAPLAALWGPNPVPRAGGRCLDVVRLLRITTDSPAVEATSTRCQAVLEAFRGRAAAARRMIDSARRTVTELGLRHALLEVEQFAGIVELVVDDPAAAEAHLRQAYNGFRRMGLDADTAETAALLGRTCLALGRDAEADELCAESERLAGHALKASIAWRMLRALLLARRGDHKEARRIAEAAVTLAERTDALVDHGDACLTLATVLGAAGDVAEARAAAERAVGLYERKSAAALAEKARGVLGERDLPTTPAPPEVPTVEPDNACVQAIRQLDAAIDREAWDEIEQLFASDVCIESRRRIVGHPCVELSPRAWIREVQRARKVGMVHHRNDVVAMRGQRLALTRTEVRTADVSPGAPQDEMLRLIGLDEEGRIALQMWFDVEDMDAAVAELDAMHARFDEVQPRVPLENGASRADDRLNALAADKRWDEFSALLADDIRVEDRRRGFRSEGSGRATVLAEARTIAELGVKNVTSQVLAIRGERLALVRIVFWGQGEKSEAYQTELLRVAQIDADNRIAAHIVFDVDDFDAAIAELDARYLAGEAAAHSRAWSVITGGNAALNRHELPPTTPDCISIDHRPGATFAPGDVIEYLRAGWDVGQDVRNYVEVVHRLSDHGAVCTHAAYGISREGFDAEWRGVDLVMVEGERVNRFELFDEADLDDALARFDQLSPPAPRLENAASQVNERFLACFAARDWATMADTLADDLFSDDRRPIVNAGLQQGRDVLIENFRSAADLEITHALPDAIATRGKRLVLTRVRYSRSDEKPEPFHLDLLQIVEIDTEDRITGLVTFDPDDFEAAITELDARYLAGEAAAHARTWSLVAGAYAALNRHELAATTTDFVSVDHRRGAAYAPGDLLSYIRAGWDLGQDISTHIEAVHRLDNFGAVVTHAAHGTSQEGFDAEWRGVQILTVEGDVINRSELFDEADLDSALARFDELNPPARRPENAASRVAERFSTHFAARDWGTIAETLADDISTDDRRRVVGAGLRQGRDAVNAELSAVTEIGVESATSDTIATRGERLVLSRARTWGRDQRPEAFLTNMLSIVEINADERIVALVTFDPDDIVAAFEELDARYLAGEAAAHAHTWSVMTRAFSALNRREMLPTTPDWVNIDHRRHGSSFAPGELPALLATWNLAPKVSSHIEVVHRLNNFGAVVSSVSHETSPDGVNAEWRVISVVTVEGDLINRFEGFDEADLDTAIARFDQLSRPAPRLKNAATQVTERFLAHFAAGDWDAMPEMMAEDFSGDDRRRVVGAGVRHGQNAQITDMRAIADLGITNWTTTHIATRGGRLALSRTRMSVRDQGPEAFYGEMLDVLEMNAAGQIVAYVVFDLDDIDAAFEELDTRYFASEAASYARTWSVIAAGYGALNRHELPPTTPDCVSIDHRRGAAFATSDLTAIVRAHLELSQDISVHVEAVHRLRKFGAVVTNMSYETSLEGFDAEWRMIQVLTVEGDLINRVELFDEAELDAALARFEELHSQERRLENAASQVAQHFSMRFAARDWDAMAETLADNYCQDDRRRVVGAGVRHGRGAQIGAMRATADLWITNMTSTVMATRGERLALMRGQFSDPDQRPEAYLTELLGIFEINADDRIVAIVSFDANDIDAAFAELDARYLAGEAAAYSHTWSVITATYAAFNKHERALPDWVVIDHRPGALFASSDMKASVHAFWDQTPDLSIHIEAVHRLGDFGAVVTHTADGTSPEGFAAEWRMIQVLSVEDDQVECCELFDEADLDAAIARFEELHPSARRLENPASRIVEQFLAHFAVRGWDAMAELLAENVSADDRRQVVNAGIRRGRDAEMANWRATGDIWSTPARSTIAIRGERLALHRFVFTSQSQRPAAFSAVALAIVEINDDNRIAGIVVFDVDDLDTAFEELDARYLAGEAAAYAHTWSVIAAAYAALNRHELPAAKRDWVNIDHRRLAMIEAGDLTASIRAGWDLSPDSGIYVEAVHRLSNLGAVVTWAGHGTSREGFYAESQGLGILTVNGDLISRCELFDEADLDTALARFEELHSQERRLENAASRVSARFLAHFAAGDWDTMAELLADNYFVDDRRRVVGAGVRHGRDAQIVDMRAIAEVWITNVTSTVIAIRGERLVLMHIRHSDSDQRPEAFHTDALVVGEINDYGRIVAAISFDANDIDAAFEELDARYLAGEAAAHAHTWSIITGTYTAVNRRQLPPMTPDFVFIDHLPLQRIEAGDLSAMVRAMRDLTPDISQHIEAVHGLSNLGAVVTRMASGTSQEGFDAEWRQIDVFTVEGDKVNRCEVFAEADLDAALARFEELHQQARRLENAASQIIERYQSCFAARDWAALAELLADDIISDDRRHVVNAGVRYGRDMQVADLQAAAEVGAESISSTVIATRGERLALARVRSRNRGLAPDEFGAEMLGIAEINTGNRITAIVAFDVDDIDAAFAELDARYLAGEGAAHAHTWSVITRAYAAMNRHELPATTPDWVNIDHRRGIAFAPGDASAYLRASQDPQGSVYVETVRRLSNLGAVFTWAGHGTSQAGFEAEWRGINVVTVEGDLINRGEIFDEADIDAALARFEELHPQVRPLENAASRVAGRVWSSFAAHDWDALTELFTDDISTEDRRRVVNAGVFRGRDAQIANMQALTEFAANVASTVIATRGECLALNRIYSSNSEDFDAELLSIIEVDSDNRAVAGVQFDPDDVDAAFAELDARYLAGEAAAHPRTWSVIARAQAAGNRHEYPSTTPDSVYIDHRPVVRIEAVDIAASLRAMWDLAPEVSFYIEAVHRLSEFGAVVTQVLKGTSQAGFDAEWRTIDIFTVDGDLISRCEVFDEANLDTSLARFDQLSRPAPLLENAATRVYERLQAYFAAREWDAMAEILAADHCSDDRRRVVNAGIRRGRDVQIANMQTAFGLGTTNITSTVIATRGERLALRRVRFSGRDQRPEAFHTETLGIVEIDADERMAALVTFDLDDMDAAFEELDARYLARETAAHSQTWSVIARECAAFNRHELTAVDYITVDHRPLPIVEAYSQAALRVWDITPDFGIHIEAVHRLSGFGAVATYQANGTSPEGFDGEWRIILLLTVEGGRINHCEVYDEADIDAALARFEELRPQAPRLENAASQIIERYLAHFAARDWAAFAELLADDIVADDRRRVVNAGIRRGRDVHIADNRVVVEVSAPTVCSSVIATRGERLALAHVRIFNRGMSGEVGAEVLGIAEIDSDERIVAIVTFDPDDIDAAFEELDARYLAGEAAAHAHTWSLNSALYAAFNRHELPATTPDWIYVDHRPLVTIDDLPTSLPAIWEQLPDIRIYMEAVHRLSDLGAVVTAAAYGSSQEGFDAEWRMIDLFTVEGDLISRCEIFDEADLDAALARFEELQPGVRRLENAATQVAELLRANFAARDWTARAELLADDCSTDDRRRVVNAGNQHGRDADIANMRAIAALGVANIALTTIATRGDRLALSRARMSGRDQRPEAFYTETLTILEIDTNNRAAAQVVFDPDDIDAAFAELDARYLAGEAAVHSHTWSIITRTYTAVNRHERPPITPDWVLVDHLPLQRIDAGDVAATIRAQWDLTPDISFRIEAVHRLSNLGGVVTRMASGTSHEGFDAEWWQVDIVTVEGDQVNRCEVFDGADLDAAIARFEELQRQARRLENAASRLTERFLSHFASRSWDAIAEMMADNSCIDDRRRVVNAGFWDGRDVVIANMRALDESGANIAWTVIATRGERLSLTRICSSNRDPRHGEFGVELLGIAEIDSDERFTAHVLFDLDDIDAAFDELDTRYLSGEAAAHAHTWSVIAGVYAAFNRHEFPATTPDWVNVDHRQLVAIEAGGVAATMRDLWDQMPDISIHAEEVHRLSDLGAVVTHAAHGRTRDGFEAEWRSINIYTVEGDSISRCEMFDEADLDAALASFDELDRPPLLENAATRIWARATDAVNRRDVDELLALTSADHRFEDRRKGLRDIFEGPVRGQKAVRALFETTPSSWRLEVEPIAIRGSRLSLTRACYRDTDDADRPIAVELLQITEVSDDDLMHDTLNFDPDDIDAAFEELDARYLAGEAAAHSHTWSVIAGAYAAINRYEFPPATPDWLNIDDHRRIAMVEPGDRNALLRVGWDLTPHFGIYIEAVHRLSARGAVVTRTGKGTSREGFAAEWRAVDILTVEGGLITRCEIFDEADLDAALARFDERDRRAPLLENAATRAWVPVTDAYNRRDLDGFLALGSAGVLFEDRRKGLRDVHHGPVRRKAVQAIFDIAPSGWQMTVEPIAIRGPRLSLTRACYRDTDDADRPIAAELLHVTEVGDDDLMRVTVSFDPDDLNDAFAELTAQWIASGEVAHPEVIEVVGRLTETTNRHDWDAFARLSAGATYVSHRQLSSPGVETVADPMTSIRTTASLVPDFWVEITEVLTHSAMGLVNHVVLRGTSTDGVAIEIPFVELILVDGDRVTRFEEFDEDQRDLALTRFDELNRSR